MNSLFAALALVCLAGFLGILAWHVPRLDLLAVIAVTLVLAFVDLVTTRR